MQSSSCCPHLLQMKVQVTQVVNRTSPRTLKAAAEWSRFLSKKTSNSVMDTEDHTPTLQSLEEHTVLPAPPVRVLSHPHRL